MAKKNSPPDFDALFGPPIPVDPDPLFGPRTDDSRGRLAALFGPPVSHAPRPSNNEDLFGAPTDISDPRRTKLVPDWSNLHLVGRVGLIQSVGADCRMWPSGLLDRMVAMMTSARAGRVGKSRLDRFGTQAGPTCQTMALLNGILAVGGDVVRGRLVTGENLSSVARTIYNALPDRPGAVGGAKSPHDALVYLQRNGFPDLRIIDHSTNPVELIDALYSGKKFLVYSTGGNHVVSWVPSPQPTSSALLHRLDSLRLGPEAYSPERFLAEWLRLPPGQQDVILVQVGN